MYMYAAWNNVCIIIEWGSSCLLFALVHRTVVGLDVGDVEYVTLFSKPATIFLGRCLSTMWQVC